MCQFFDNFLKFSELKKDVCMYVTYLKRALETLWDAKFKRHTKYELNIG